MAKEEERTRTPHLSNLNEDPALTNKLVHLIKPGVCVQQTFHSAKSLDFGTGLFLNCVSVTCSLKHTGGPNS